MAYPTTIQLIGASSVEALTSLSGAEQDSLRGAAIAAIEHHCNQSFDAQPNVTLTLSGTGAMYLHLPRRLEALDALTINGVAASVSDIAISDRHNKITFKSLLGSNYYERELRDWDDETIDFASGAENIVLTGDWGWTVCPEAVATAIRYDMEDSAMAEQSELGPTIQAYRKLGLKDVTQGNLSATIDDVPPLSPRVVHLLAGLIWRDPAGIVV